MIHSFSSSCPSPKLRARSPIPCAGIPRSRRYVHSCAKEGRFLSASVTSFGHDPYRSGLSCILGPLSPSRRSSSSRSLCFEGLAGSPRCGVRELSARRMDGRGGIDRPLNQTGIVVLIDLDAIAALGIAGFLILVMFCGSSSEDPQTQALVPAGPFNFSCRVSSGPSCRLRSHTCISSTTPQGRNRPPLAWSRCPFLDPAPGTHARVEKILGAPSSRRVDWSGSGNLAPHLPVAGNVLRWATRSFGRYARFQAILFTLILATTASRSSPGDRTAPRRRGGPPKRGEESIPDAAAAGENAEALWPPETRRARYAAFGASRPTRRRVREDLSPCTPVILRSYAGSFRLGEEPYRPCAGVCARRYAGRCRAPRAKTTCRRAPRAALGAR